ncbi:hypothetical protein LXL04_008383 [Taraxacum kok-saghyz]
MDRDFTKYQSRDPQQHYIPYITYPGQTFQNYLNFPPPPDCLQNFPISNESGKFYVHPQATSMLMFPNESRKGTVLEESGHIEIAHGDQFPTHSTTPKALQNIDLNIGVSIDEAVDDVVNGADKIHGTNGKRDRTQWSVEEESILVESWATISNDSVVGIDQTNSTFWERITTYYNGHRPTGTPLRLPGRAKTHFYQFYSIVNEFTAIYNNFYNNRGSCWSDETVLEKSHEQWRHNNKAKKNKPDHHASKKRSNLDPDEFIRGSSSSPFPNPDSTCELDDCIVRPRPIGQKVAKRKGKFKAKENIDDNTQWNNMLDIQSQKLKLKDVELRQKDNDILLKDTTGMTSAQQILHGNICEQIKKDCGLM